MSNLTRCLRCTVLPIVYRSSGLSSAEELPKCGMSEQHEHTYTQRRLMGSQYDSHDKHGKALLG